MKTREQRPMPARKARRLRRKHREQWADQMALTTRERWELAAGVACICVFVWIFIVEAFGS